MLACCNMLLQGDIKFFQFGTLKHKYFCTFLIPVFLGDYSCYCWITEFFELSCVELSFAEKNLSISGRRVLNAQNVIAFCVDFLSPFFFFFLLKSFHLKLAEIGSCTYERWDSWLLLAASLPCCLMTNPVIPLPWNGWCRVTAVAFKWKEIMMRDNYWKAHCNSGTKIWNQLETLSSVKAASYSHKLKPWNNGINFKKKVLVFFPTLLWYTASIS